MSNWSNLSIKERAELINMYLDGGIMSLSQMKDHYNSFEEGGYKPSQSIIDYIKGTEAFRSKWYLDGNGVPTVGYGFTGEYFKKKYPNGMTKEEADREFERVINKFVNYVKLHTPNYDSLSQNQKDSLLSYMYNVGPGNYTTKSPKFQKALREKDWKAVAENMDIGYNDKKNRGLRKRRDYERALFLGNSSGLSASPTQYYDEYTAKIASSPVPPEAGEIPPVGMPTIYYNTSPEIKEQDFSKPLPIFDPNLSYDPYNSYIPTKRERRRERRLAEAEVPQIPTNDEIIGGLLNTLSSQENIFKEGGDTDLPIGKPLYWNPEPIQEEVKIPLRDQSQVPVLLHKKEPDFGNRIRVVDKEKQKLIDDIVNNIDFSKISLEDSSPKYQADGVKNVKHNSGYNNSAVYKPLKSMIVENEVLKNNSVNTVQQIISSLRSEDDVKKFQKELYEKGYLKADTPKIKAKTKDEIKELQRKLKSAGYDIGNSGKDKDGVDGIIGSKTRAAWEKYSKEHFDEAALDSIVDGKVGRKTMAAATAYYKDILDNKQNIDSQEITSSEDPYALSVQMYRNIPTLQKISSLVGTTIPSHVGAFANKTELSRIGKQEGIEDYDAFVADEIEAASEALSAAKKSGNEAKIMEAKERVNAAREKLKTNKLNKSKLSNAEKKAAMAILTGINGGRQMTYDDYLSNLSLIGGEDGSYLGSNPRHKHKKSGKDVILYDNRSGYHVMNEAENSRGGMEDKEANDSWLRNVIDAEKRIYEDPNRGRLGAFSYYVDNNGDIHIYDRLEATEKKAARGANDKANYNAARDFFPRSSTSEMRDIITAEEYKNYIEKVLRKEKRKSKKE